MSDFSFRPDFLADLVLDEFPGAVQQKTRPVLQKPSAILNSAKSNACTAFPQRRGSRRRLYITLHQPHQGETEPRYLLVIESHSTQEGTGS
jgi:hypothetical protein